MIKAIIFDIDGVLLDSFQANLRFFQDLMVATGYRPPTREDFYNFFHLPMWDAIKVMTASRSEDEVARIFKIGESSAVPYHTELISLPDQVAEVIEKLSRKYFLGIVTSRIRSNVYEVPAISALKKYFKVVVSYEDTTEHKPNPEPLFLAVEELGVKPEESVYIGDAATDIEAAHAAKMKIIIYSKNDLPGADARASVFAQLPDLIQNI